MSAKQILIGKTSHRKPHFYYILALLLGGGTGFIGKRLSKILSNDVTIISRMPGLRRITWMDLENNGLPKGGDIAVVNLAGQNVLDPTRRWTPG